MSGSPLARLAMLSPGAGVEVENYKYSRIGEGVGSASSSKRDDGRIGPLDGGGGGWTRRCLCQVLFRYRFVLWFLLIVAIFVLYIVFFNVGLIFDRNTERFSSASISDPSAKTVVLLGDSLLNRPFTSYNFGAMLRRRLSSHSLVVWNEGLDGNTIRNIADRLDSALSHDPEAVLLLWDSDVSDTNESLLNSTQVATLRAAYTSTLQGVVNDTLHYPSVKYLAVSGPGVLGENPDAMFSFQPPRFEDKKDMLDAYRLINQQVAAEFGVDYIDLRTSLVQAVPFYWTWYKWWLTKDGEHLNYRGSIILADLFAEALDEYLEG